jgi:2-polyprenyl-6-methoxyphenol hydroxylase-like FAD-dependent oxidoreductase
MSVSKAASAASISPAFQTEVAVIGAGVVGLAIARALAISGKEVLILDRASAIGSGRVPACVVSC